MSNIIDTTKPSIFEALGAMKCVFSEIESNENYDNCLIVLDYLNNQKETNNMLQALDYVRPLLCGYYEWDLMAFDKVAKKFGVDVEKLKEKYFA